MLPALAAVLAAAQPAEPAKPPAPGLGRTAWVFATVAHSEWCPAGNVRLYLRTGRYTVARRAPRPSCREVLDRPLTTGTLDPESLSAVRAASSRVAAEGFESRACRDGEPPETIILSNGGTPVVVLTTGFATRSAPDDQSCWSDAAKALHDLLDETFASISKR